jgi:hypothetical protein
MISPTSISLFRYKLRCLLPAWLALGLLCAAIASPAYGLGPDLYVHGECQFCASTYDSTTITINFELGGGPYVDGHYVVRQCDNNGFNCHNRDLWIANNTIVSGTP